MKIITLQKISEPVRRVKELFATKPGWDFEKDIADNKENIPMPKYYSLQSVYNIVTETNPRHILEFGGGIGTLDYLCLENSQAILDIYEDNEFCQKQLEINLAKFAGRYHIFKDQNNFQHSFDTYDLVIIDGNWLGSIEPLVQQTKNLGRIYFDGCRYKMRKKIIKALSKKYSCDYFKLQNTSDFPKTGFLLVCKLDNNLFTRYINYVHNYLCTIIEEKLKRGVKNLIRIQLKHLYWNLKKIIK